MARGKKARVPRHLKSFLDAIPFLSVLSELGPKQRSIIVGHLDGPSCKVISKVVVGLANSRNLTAKQKSKLKRLYAVHKKCFQDVKTDKTSARLRRKRLGKVGGFPLGAILATAVPLLVQLLVGSAQ